MSTGIDPAKLDELQARLIERLRAADGAPVSFEELRAIGIENPALLCYELAAVGLPVRRTCSPAEGMPALSVRLEPSGEEPPPETGEPDGPDGAPAAAEPARATPAVALRARELARAGVQPMLRLVQTVGRRLQARARRSRSERHPHPPRLMAASALAVVAATIVAMSLGSGERRAARPGSRAAHAATHQQTPTPAGAQAPRAPSAPVARPVPLLAQSIARPDAAAAGSPEQATALQAAGHQLLGEGSYASAITRLLAAVRMSGQNLPRCAEPASDACLTFAYALYDLGRALRLEGRHAEAITILSQRLQIDNQRPVVRRELELARGASSL
jgi:tetratricopeptide (TPR) repeat protein